MSWLDQQRLLPLCFLTLVLVVVCPVHIASLLGVSLVSCAWGPCDSIVETELPYPLLSFLTVRHSIRWGARTSPSDFFFLVIDFKPR